MRAFSLLLLCTFSFFVSFAQVKDLVKRGTTLHDKGDYEGAIKLYDQAIQKDPTYFLAYYEKAYSLYTAGKYQECVDLCKGLIKQFPQEDELRSIYINYGSALDALGNPEEALSIYSEGIKKFPGSYLLYFNRGVTEYLQEDMTKATADFQKSVTLNPGHASSHQFLGYCMYEENKVAAIMSLTAFLVYEPEGERAKKNLKLLLQLLGSNVEKKEDKSIKITMSPDMGKKKKKKEDDFSITEMTLTFGAALDLGETKKDLNDAQKLEEKLSIISAMDTEKKKSKRGFFTNFYVPFFQAMNKNSLLETVSYILYLAGDKEELKKWVQDNDSKTSTFYKWLETYQWVKEE